MYVVYNIMMRDLIVKVKLSLYSTFSKNVGFKKYLHGVSDAPI